MYLIKFFGSQQKKIKSGCCYEGAQQHLLFDFSILRKVRKGIMTTIKKEAIFCSILL